MKEKNRFSISIDENKKIENTISPLKRFFDEITMTPKKEVMMEIDKELPSLTLREKLINKLPIYNVNDIIGGNYILKSFLGGGTFGEVHMALDKRYNKDVAIKIQKVALSNKKDLNSPFKTDSSLFTREIMALSKLSSECRKYVCVYDAGLLSNNEKEVKEIPTDFCIYYIVTEFVHGLTLSKFIEKRKKTYDDNDILFMFKGMVNGLFELHKQKIFHSDIKTENMMIDGSGNIKYIDFGLACDFNYKKKCVASGTPGYMSPEYIEKRNKKDYIVNMDDVHINDWYSLAMVMYEVLSRKSIHSSFTADALPEAALDDMYKMDVKYLKRNKMILVFIIAGLQRDPTIRLQFLIEWYDEYNKYI